MSERKRSRPEEERRETGGESRGRGRGRGGRGRGRGRAKGNIVPDKKPRTDSGLSMAEPENIETPPNAREVNVLSNFFQMRIKTGTTYYQYDVKFKDEFVSEAKCLRGMSQHPDLGLWVFDGTTLITNQKFSDPCELTVSQEPKITLFLTFTRVLSINELGPEVTQLFNRIIRHAYNLLKLVPDGNNIIDPSVAAIKFRRHGVEAMQAYHSSVQFCKAGAFLNLDTKNRFIREETAMQALKEKMKETGGAKKSAERELVGTVVMTRYNNRTYRITGVDWDKTPRDEFNARDKKITFDDYYRDAYNIEIKTKDQPLLKASAQTQGGRKREVMLIPELCFMTGLKDKSLLRDIARDVRIAPKDRAKRLHHFVSERLCKSPETREHFEKWGFEINNKLREVTGCQMEPEKIKYGDQEVNGPNWNAKSKDIKLRDSGKSLNNWAVISTSRDRETVNKFLKNLQTVYGKMDVRVNRPEIFTARSQRESDFVNAVRDAVGSSSRPEFILVFLPNKDKRRYSSLKSYLTKDVPVLSQCIVCNTASKGLSVATNLFLQIQAKKNADLWLVKHPLQRTMICAIDVGRSGSRGKSVPLGFCATMNDHFSQIFTKSAFVETNHLKDTVSMNVVEAVKEYEKVNGTKPQSILFYRDGASEGQTNYVLHQELKQVIDKIKDAEYNPEISYILVNKNTNQKFFNQKTKDGNPEPGTAVYNTITQRDKFEFFLISSSAPPGTCVRPVRYHILYNTTKLKGQHFIMLTYKLCHMYYNWTGTIRIPSPLMYAQKLSQFMSTVNTDHFHESLAHNKFYL
eukprot:gb/GECH01003553.1/.p1 GENE.gb/GECH01003553.1/~~gb/GECH01003553.1/.p1  ORF type:complete len:801 (+),score=100.64 gb/GECH01003553.1/:1-2403(+)